MHDPLISPDDEVDDGDSQDWSPYPPRYFAERAEGSIGLAAIMTGLGCVIAAGHVLGGCIKITDRVLRKVATKLPLQPT